MTASATPIENADPQGAPTMPTNMPASDAAKEHQQITETITALSRDAVAIEGRLAAARDEQEQLDIEQKKASMLLQQRVAERRKHVFGATLDLGPDRVAAFVEEGAAALADFRAAVAATPWGAALIKWQLAVAKSYFWEAASNNAQRALDPTSARGSYEVRRSDLTPELVADLITETIVAEVRVGIGRFNASQADHAERYIRGEVDDPTPPAE